MVAVLWTGSDRFGYAVSTSLHGLPPNFTHALKIAWKVSSAHFDQLDLLEVVETALCHASVGVRCELVLTSVKFNFFRRSSTIDTSMDSSRLAEFECEILPGYDVR